MAEKEETEGLLSKNPQFKAFASSVEYGIIVGSTKGRIVDFNSAALRMFGWTEDELRGQFITVLMPPRFRELHTAGMARYNKTKKPKMLGQTMRLFGITKDGKEFPIELALSSWKDTDGTEYFTASIRRYSSLENKLGWLVGITAVTGLLMLVGLVILTAQTFF